MNTRAKARVGVCLESYAFIDSFPLIQLLLLCVDLQA